MMTNIQLVRVTSIPNNEIEAVEINGFTTDGYPNSAFALQEKTDYSTTNSNKTEPTSIQQTVETDSKDNPDDVESKTGNSFSRGVDRLQSTLSEIWLKHGDMIIWFIEAIFLAGYSAYFAYALYYEFGSEASVRLLWMTMLVAGCCLIVLIRDYYGDVIVKYIIDPLTKFVEKHYRIFFSLFVLLVIGGLLAFFIVDVILKRPANMISFSGYVVFIVGLFIFSSSPSKVKWRPVLWGLGIQFIFALLVLRTYAGYVSFLWLGDRIQEYLAYTDAGSIFVFGETYEDHYFAMKVLPVVVFFSATISVLYYLGWMQAVILKIAWVMQRSLGTTAPESVNAAGNIFIGQSEAPLLIRPFLADMTNSELHAVMVGGYATIAGSVMATYIMFGVPANHLLTASVMAAPCALAMSKLYYPETEQTKVTNESVQAEASPYGSGIEAASVGASISIKLVANIAVNLIAFIAFLEFFNTTLTWCGHRIGMWPPEYQELTFEMICSYVLWPLAFVMGVATLDCRKVAELIGVKIFLNEFVAFTELGTIIDNTEIFSSYNGTYTYYHDDIFLHDLNVTLVGGVMERRSIVISTYALCGFANLSSVGMVIGALTSMAPARRTDIASMAFRAMICGCVVSFMNACTAGLLYDD